MAIVHPTAQRPHRPPRRCGSLIALLGLSLMFCGCRTVSFYHQAVSGHASIVLKKKPIETVLADPRTAGPVRTKLELIVALREFARQELDLPANGQFRHYAEIDRPFVVWDIYAAPEFSLDAKSWWYPFVGHLTYRGYFSERQARDQARILQSEGYEVFVGGIDAYSTLGWFQDPVLSTFLNRDEADLADLVFHELAHQRLFIDGDTDFNEAFATTVAREGVRRWFRERVGPERLSRLEHRWRREEQFIALVLSARQRLERLYEQAPPSAQAGREGIQVLRRLKAEIFSQLRKDYLTLKASWNNASEFDIWFDYPLNNARLNAEATYYALIPAFEQLLSECEHSLPAFYLAVETLGHQDAPTRDQRLEALHQRAPAGPALPGLVRHPTPNANGTAPDG